jgi:uracil-DNA glycosylase
MAARHLFYNPDNMAAAINIDDVKLEQSWKTALHDQLIGPQMANLKAFLREEKAAGKIIFPKGSAIFRALDLTPLDKVRVVILGQDPYHGPDQAHGLSFSVKPGVKVPPSLANIYKELKNDLGINPPNHGFLEHWAQQGVLLLNSVLTVEMGKAASHRGRGWEEFTDAVIGHINERTDPMVFMLWGSYAQKKAARVDSRHLVLHAPHPSPLSAYKGFLGCGHFGKCNAFLQAQGKSPIDWALPPI